MRPEGRYIENLAVTQNCIYRFCLGDLIVFNEVKVGHIDNRVAEAGVALVRNIGEVLTGAGWVEHIAPRTTKHRDHIAPRIVVRRRIGATHTKAALNTLVVFRRRNEEIRLSGGEKWQITIEKIVGKPVSTARTRAKVMMRLLRTHFGLVCPASHVAELAIAHADDIRRSFYLS